MTSPRGKAEKGRYRKAAFTHWLNLGFLAAAGIAGIAFSPAILLAAIPLELGALWILPDLPNFRAAVDAHYDAAKLHREREYYMEQLWGLFPAQKKGFFAGLFTHTEEIPLEDRVMQRDDPNFLVYLELLDTVRRLSELQQVRKVTIPGHAFERFDQVMTAYLRMLVASRTLAQALHGVDELQIKRELEEVDAQLETAPRELRAVLGERKRLFETRLQRLPRLQATLELYRTRADAIAYQLRNLHGQVLTDPGTDVTSFLDDLVERQDILADPLGDLEADRTVHELLQTRAR